MARHVPFDVALSAAMGLESGKHVVWWCPSLTLRVVISRWKRPRRNLQTCALARRKHVVWWWPQRSDSAVSQAIALRALCTCSAPSRFRIPSSGSGLSCPFGQRGHIRSSPPPRVVLLSAAALRLRCARRLLAVASGWVANPFGPALGRDVGNDEFGKPDPLCLASQSRSCESIEVLRVNRAFSAECS